MLASVIQPRQGPLFREDHALPRWHVQLSDHVIPALVWRDNLRRVTSRKELEMKKLFLAVLIPLSLGGCLSFHENPPPPRNTTVVVPPGATVTCPNGSTAPC